MRAAYKYRYKRKSQASGRFLHPIRKHTALNWVRYVCTYCYLGTRVVRKTSE